MGPATPTLTSLGQLQCGGLQASPEKFNAVDSWQTRLPLYTKSFTRPEPAVVEFERPDVLPVGPGSQAARLTWPHDVWARLTEDQRDWLMINLRHCVWAGDMFSGIGSREQILCQIVGCVTEKLGGNAAPLPSSAIKAFTVCEVNEDKLRFMEHFKPKVRPIHVTSDIIQRLLPETRDTVKRLEDRNKGRGTIAAKKFNNAQLEHVLAKEYCERGRAMLCAPCLQHPQFPCCPVSYDFIPDESSDIECETSPYTIKIRTAATPCVDTSQMAGQMAGDGGMARCATQMCLMESGLLRDDIAFYECTPAWPCAQLQDAMGGNYRVWKLHLGGTDQGDLYNRMRLAAVALGPRVAWTTPPEKFLHVCGYCIL